MFAEVFNGENGPSHKSQLFQDHFHGKHSSGTYSLNSNIKLRVVLSQGVFNRIRNNSLEVRHNIMGNCQNIFCFIVFFTLKARHEKLIAVSDL